jgi:ubiquinone/menaquinone biosynthesis C-methylase UbiE
MIQRPLLRRELPHIVSPAERYESDKVPLMFKPLARLFLKRVPLKRGDRVLDVACGTGIVARLVAPVVGASGQVIGIDISADLLRVAGANTPLSNTSSSSAPIQWRLGDAAKLPVEDEAFDLVLCQQGFQYFPDQAAALREMYRALAPGGRLALCVARSVEAEHQPYQWAKFKALTLHVSPEAGQDARRLAPFFCGDSSVLMKMIAEAGFQNPEVEDVTIKVQMGPLDHFIHEDVFPDLANDVQTAVVKHIHKAMESYMNDRGVEIPYGMHIASALKGNSFLDRR